jgi:hypothetical protein
MANTASVPKRERVRRLAFMAFRALPQIELVRGSPRNFAPGVARFGAEPVSIWRQPRVSVFGTKWGGS